MKRVCKDERGSALVTTIVAVTFISLLAVAVITMTITNIRLKSAQKHSQKNFYNADSIIDAIRAGVEDLSDSAAKEAYTTAFSSYATVHSSTSDSLSEKYTAQFLKSMVIALSDGTETVQSNVTEYHFKDEVIRGYLTAAQSNCYASHTAGSGEMILEDNTLILKDIKVAKTENSYQTTITTDIRINVPEMKAETHSEYLNYALIADNQIIAREGGTATVNGDVYSGTVRRHNAGASDPEAGIIIENGTSLSLNAENVITRGDLLLRGDSEAKLDGLNGMDSNIWVENIHTKSAGTNGNKLSINGICNVADDLEIWGEHDSIKLSGEYYGYNYNDSYDPTNQLNVSTSSEYSSAIMINGKKCTLDMSGIKTLVLSGKTFVSKKTNAESYAGTTNSIVNQDIGMGESLTVKGSQLAYYVPSDFVSTKAASNTSYPYTEDGKIHFRYATDLGTEYIFDFQGYNDYLNIPNFDIRNYVSLSTPLVYYYRNDMNVSSDALEYFYLNFKDDLAMTQFYPLYSTGSPQYDNVRDVNKAFMSDVGILINQSAVFYCRAGNILYKDQADGSQKLLIKNESLAPDNVLVNKATSKSVEYMSRQLALVSDYDKISGSNQWRLSADDSQEFTKSGNSDVNAEKTNLFSVLIDETKLTSDQPEEVINDKDGNPKGVVKITSGDYTWDSSKKSTFGSSGIIIAKGDVTLKDDFSGLVLAGGDIKIGASGVKIASDSVLMEEIFTLDKNAASPVFYNMFSKYFRKIVDSSIGEGDSDDEEAVCYENWKRN